MPVTQPATEKLIASVPPATCAQPGIAAGHRWSASFNASCWVRCRSASGSLVRLVLRVRDGSGKQRDVEVDRASCAREGTMLLSAMVAVPATGRIEEMTVWLLAEPAAELFVDELFVQRTGLSATSRPVISSR